MSALRVELATAQASQAELERESQQLMLQVHSLQCQLHSKTAPHESDMIKKKLVGITFITVHHYGRAFNVPLLLHSHVKTG